MQRVDNAVRRVSNFIQASQNTHTTRRRQQPLHDDWVVVGDEPLHRPSPAATTPVHPGTPPRRGASSSGAEPSDADFAEIRAFIDTLDKATSKLGPRRPNHEVSESLWARSSVSRPVGMQLGLRAAGMRTFAPARGAFMGKKAVPAHPESEDTD